MLQRAVALRKVPSPAANLSAHRACKVLLQVLVDSCGTCLPGRYNYGDGSKKLISLTTPPQSPSHVVWQLAVPIRAIAWLSAQAVAK